MISLNVATKFHGHLGPWLVIGLIMGELGLKKVKANKYFGLKVNATIPNRKPITCLIDGLQLSSGCTLGKGNIKIVPSKRIKVKFSNKKNKKTISLGIKDNIIARLRKVKTHEDSIILAKQIYRWKPNQLIKILEGAF